MDSLPKNEDYLKSLFDLSGKVAVVTGGGGVLCQLICKSLARLDVKVAILDISIEAAKKVESAIIDFGERALAIQCNVMDEASLETAAQQVIQTFTRIDILINGAGGNKKEATTGPDLSFFDLPIQAFQDVFNLNFTGTLISCQVFGKWMAQQRSGAILNFSSMNYLRPLTRVPAYSAAKAAVSNFTQWLSVHMAQEYSPDIRVNAIAPGFLITEQNRFLLTDPNTGEPTPRGKAILAHTPAGRFGIPDDLLGTVIWLLSPASAHVTGIVVPIDGGFSAYSGV